MSSDIAISVQNLNKTYRLFDHPGDRIKQFFSMGMKQYHKEFTALKDVSFEIKRGETVGIIGRNGSGKSTLLQLICGILKPTSGSVQVNGRISALLELGAGFNPEFTGRENVYFQGTLMGFTKAQMDERFDDIAAFADIGDFIDQPVRTYSSGMFVRLAFTVATNTDPEILIIDEALSVGDAAFQHKSRRRMQQFTNSGGTLLVVSHDRMTISGLCDRCVLLGDGRALRDGKPTAVFDYYHAIISTKNEAQVSVRQLDAGRLQVTSGTGEANVISILLLDEEGKEAQTVEVGSAVILEFIVKITESIPRLVLGFSIHDRFGQDIFGINTIGYNKEIDEPPIGNMYRFRFNFIVNLGAGSYSISTALHSTNNHLENNYECRDLSYFFEVHNFTNPKFAGTSWLNPKLTIEIT